MSGLKRLDTALEALDAGSPVLVTDDESRENEGDVILSAARLTARWMAWTIRHTSGYLCAPMPSALADELDLPLMVPFPDDPLRTAYTVSVDARDGVSTGISAADRTRTCRQLADPRSTAQDFVRPGHVLPLRARDGGVLERRGHTEATVDLCRLAGLAPVGVIGELVRDDGSMMRSAEIETFAASHGVPTLTIEEIASHRNSHDRVTQVATTQLPTAHGVFAVRGYRDLATRAEHVALISPLGLGDRPLVRVHSECLTGEAFGSQRCDCAPQLDDAFHRLGSQGGCIIYLRGHEGRGVGLLDKLRAYAAQDCGLDTVDAQRELGLPIDAREYGAAAAILKSLGAVSIQLLTNNPAKVAGLIAGGVDVVHVVPQRSLVTATNERYLAAKRDRMGHRCVTRTEDDPGATSTDHGLLP